MHIGIAKQSIMVYNISVDFLHRRCGMLKKIIGCFVLAAFVLVCSSCMKLTKMIDVTKETNMPPKAVYLGDSIAAGYGLDGYAADDLYKCRSYPNILADKYSSSLADKCGHTTVNKAVSGDTSADLLGDLESGLLDDALAGSDAVIISIGGNDLLHVFLRLFESIGYDRDIGRVDLSDADILKAASGLIGLDGDIEDALSGFETNLNLIVDKIKEKTDGEIYVQELYNPFEYFDKVGVLVDYTTEKVNKFNRIVVGNSGRDGVHRYSVVDIASAFEGRCDELTNIKLYDIHPNAAGHVVISEKVSSEITKNTYTYTTQEEVTDDDAVATLIFICISVSVIVIGGVIVLIVILRKRVRNRKED